MSNQLTHISKFLNERVDKLQVDARHGVEAAKLVDAAMVAVHTTPTLQQCNPISIYIALKRAATLGLHPGTRGGAHLVPFRNRDGGWDAQLIIGYRGAIAMCTRSGAVKAIRARVVKRNDVFEVYQGTTESIVHSPKLPPEQGAETVAVYAVAELGNGHQQFEVMSAEEVDAIRAKSRAGNSGPWKDYFDEMAKKTVILRLTKCLPVQFDYAHDFDTPDFAPAAPSHRVIDMPVEPPPNSPVTTAPEELRRKLSLEQELATPAFQRKDQ